jgi:C4-dicarboxylate-specific signal transduction histidine kinase
VSLIEKSSEFIGYTPTVGAPVAYLNAAGRRLVGLGLDEDISKLHIGDFHPTEDHQLFIDEILPALLRDGYWEGERVMRHFGTNAEIPVLQTIFFITDTGSNRRTAIATICRDITQRKLDMVMQRQAEEALEKAKAELAHISRLTTMGELAASIAHELNQPLMAIVTGAEACLVRLGKKRPEIDKARQAAERVIKNGHRAGDIIRNIRALVQKSSPEMSRLDINVVVRDVLDLMRAELRRHDVLVKTEFGVGLGLVTGDRVQLQQIVLNVVLNGIEAMSGIANRGRILSVKTSRDEGGEIRTSIGDVGAGLESTNVDRIFEPFFTTKPEGMGMGLSICRSIVDAHGGRLWASARQPYGVTIHFTLPCDNGGALGSTC